MKSKRGRDRIGQFKMSSIIARDTPDIAAEILSIMGAVPVRVEHMWAMDIFEYTAISKMFRYASVGEITPKYEVEVTSNEEGFPASVSVKEVK